MENNINNNKPNRPIIPTGTHLLGSEFVIDKYFKSGGMITDLYICHNENEPNKKLIAKIVYRKSIKMTDDAWNRVQAEATSALRVLNQPNLIQTYRVLKRSGDDPCIIIIMDHVEGISLREYLWLHGCLVPSKALAIFLKILKGIKVLHNFKHQIIHRDLKPENIIVSYDLSKVTIIDFGIATVIDKSDSLVVANAENTVDNKNKVLNDESVLYGTLEYIIPDVLNTYKKNNNERNITVQADFFSLGVILYEMIIGQKPFDYSTRNGENAKIKIPLKYDMLNISANPSIPVALENIIFRCLACKPEDLQFRYNKIEEIIDDVNKAIPLLNKNDDTKLLKPVCKRSYQKAKHFDTDVVRSRQKWYKQWWFFGVVSFVSLTILIACIVMFFVL